jgi:hypothetical protein
MYNKIIIVLTLCHHCNSVFRNVKPRRRNLPKNEERPTQKCVGLSSVIVGCLAFRFVRNINNALLNCIQRGLGAIG